MSSKKKVAAVLITTVAISAGTVGIASADSKGKNNRTTISQISGKGFHGHDLSATLAALVAKGTITQAQADAILASANAAKAAAEAAKPLKANHAERLALIAKTIGLDTATVQSRLTAGETLATIAGAKKDALIAALVADETKRIDAAVTAGTITAAQATTSKANLTTHITEHVNSTHGWLGKGHGKGHRGGHGMKGWATPAPTASTAALSNA
jgi:hypothetical protein